MGWGGALVLVAIQAVSLCSSPRAAAAAGGGLPPVVAPVTTNGLCNVVECGKGKCRLSTNHTFGFVCECDPGWTKPHIGSYFQFLPCVIPNCSLDYSCFRSAMAPAPSLSSPPPPSNRSLFDPCLWSLCGEGTCVRTSFFGHRCDCNPGFGNLLNITSFPCFRQCVLGLDCARLGIVLPNGISPLPSSSPTPLSSPASPPSLSGPTPNAARTVSPGSLMWFSPLMTLLAIILRT